MTTTTIAKINEVSILLIDDDEKVIPIKPICDVLGIDSDSQRKKIKEDEILEPTTVLSTVVAADGKQREMLCMHYTYVFGWLFTINPNNVAPEAKENVLRYKKECYKVLADHFMLQGEFIEKKQKAVESKLNEIKKLKSNFNTAKHELDKANKDLDKIQEQNFEKWKEDGKQTSIFDVLDND